MQIAIIGAGIGGLTAAIGLQKQGHQVRIYESAAQLQPVGAGLWMAPNGQQVLDRLDPDLLKAVVAAGFITQEALIMTHSGDILSRVEAQAFKARYSHAETLAIQRSELHRLLSQALQPESLKLDHRLLNFYESEKQISLTFANGAQAQAELVIGADGIHSLVRQKLFGELPLRYSGQTCWRGLSPLSLSGDWQNKAAEIWGDEAGLRIGFSHVSGQKVYFYITLLAEAGRSSSAIQDKRFLLDKLRVFPAIAQDLLEATPAEKLIHSDLWDLPPIRHYAKGRLVLLGDAAHATTPNLGQGANQAMESALALANVLPRELEATPEALGQALRQYEQRRIPKASQVIKSSWQINQLVNLRNPLLRKARNFAISHLPAALAQRQFERLYSLSV